MIDKIKTYEQPAHPFYKDKETFDFQLLLDKNQYTNTTNTTTAIDATMAPVNNFFAHWVKEIDITKYGTNKQLIPTSTPREIYQYSDAMLKYLSEKDLKKLRKHVLFSKKEVIYTAGVDRRPHNDDTANKRIDDNLDNRIAKFPAQIQNKFTCRFPLRCRCDLGKINFPTKIDMKIRLTLETDLKKLFESYFVLLKAPYLQYEQIVLAKNFRQYLESTLFSAKVLRMGVQKTPYQKTWELQTGTQDFTVDFIGAKRKFDWVEILLVYDKSDKHLTLYDNYNAECATRLLKSLEFGNILEEYSATNKLRFDSSDNLQKHLLYKQCAAWHTNGCSTAPLTDFASNPIFQELKDESDYYGVDSDERVYVDLRDSRGYLNELNKPSRNDLKITINIELKNSLAKKMRLRVWGYTNGEYLYMQQDSALTLKYKTYTIKSQYEELEA